MDAPSPSRTARTVLLFFGCCVPPILAALGIFGLSDLELAAEARIQRDAALRGRSVQNEWETRLGRQAPIAASVADLTLRSGGLGLAPSGRSRASREAAQAADLHLLAATADLAAGRLEPGLQHLEEALAADPSRSGRVLLALTHGLRLRADFPSDRRLSELRRLYGEWAPRIPQGADVDGTSARLLGLLSAGQWLEPAAVAAEAKDFAEALRGGVAPMPIPTRDRVFWNPPGSSLQSGQGLVLVSDPWWRAIKTMAETRLGFASVDWDAVLMGDKRRAAAASKQWLAGALEDGLGPWALHRIPESPAWIAVRQLGADKWRATFHTAKQLDRALAAGLKEELPELLEGDEGYRVAAFSKPTGATPILRELPLAGVRVHLSVLNDDPDAILRPVRLRLTLLRIGLLSVAALLALAAALAWVALRRDARLRGLRSTFVASVSHDLRTPVASIGLIADNMASGYADGSEAVYIESLQGETARLRRLIDDLLDFGRIERGLPPRVRRAPVALAEWIETFAAAERERCHGRACTLDLVTENLPISARLDVSAMERALQNLVDNAIKHGRAASMTLSVRGAGDTLVFELTDSGSGLTAAALRADLFRPFERGAAGTAGTGLGLSIVRAIAEGHGGSASLRPVHRGPGTTGAVATLTVAIREGRSA